MSRYVISGIEIDITSSLRRYVSIQREFSEKTKETLTNLSENARFYDSALKQTSLVRAETSIYIDQLLANLMRRCNYYDCAREDFLQDESYAHLMRIQDAYDKYCELLKSNQKALANIKLAQAAGEAASKVTGLNFGIISNSIAAHLLYQAQNEATIRRQKAEAEQYYSRQERLIQAQAEQKASLESHEYYNKVFMPQMKAATQQVYRGIMVSYLRILHKLGIIDINEIKDYDHERSQQILRNIVGSSNPERVIATALSICPFNTDVYVQANKYDVLTDSILSIAEEIGLKEDILSIIKPQDPEEDEIIENELDRFLYNEVDEYDDNWKSRANAYLRESRSLIQRYPNSFAGYGLVASYIISVNWNTKYGSFWSEVNSNLDKFFELYTGDEGYAYHFKTILNQISRYFNTYFRVSERLLNEIGFNNSEYTMWNNVASVKSSQIPALEAVQYFIAKMEGCSKTDIISWYINMQKNELLWFTCCFCTPHIIHKSLDGSGWNTVPMRYHLPLSERTFAIDLYDKLMAEGVGNYTSGQYAFEKSHKDQPRSNFSIYAEDVWREEISTEGMRYIKEGTTPVQQSGGCYIATCVYGSYDCPQVWVLRRFRDNTLDASVFGRLFIKLYYAISPFLVAHLGRFSCVRRIWRSITDSMVNSLERKGVSSTPYCDKHH